MKILFEIVWFSNTWSNTFKYYQIIFDNICFWQQQVIHPSFCHTFSYFLNFWHTFSGFGTLSQLLAHILKFSHTFLHSLPLSQLFAHFLINCQFLHTLSYLVNFCTLSHAISVSCILFLNISHFLNIWTQKWRIKLNSFSNKKSNFVEQSFKNICFWT